MTIVLHMLPGEAFLYLLAFARIGSAVMLFPVFGEPSVPPQLRLVIALALALLILPVARAALPPLPEGMLGALAILVKEILFGLVLGTLARMLISVLNVAGTAISMFTGLGFAQGFDPSQGTQSAVTGSFLSLLAVTLLAVSNMHYLLIDALADSYRYFPPQGPIPVGDLSSLAVRWVAGAFVMGLKLSFPFMAFSLLFYMGMGVMSKLMPQVQIFFLAMPLNILAGLVLLSLLVSALMMAFLGFFEAQIAVLRGV